MRLNIEKPTKTELHSKFNVIYYFPSQKILATMMSYLVIRSSINLTQLILILLKNIKFLAWESSKKFKAFFYHLQH